MRLRLRPVNNNKEKNMKKARKLLLLIPAFGLFLSGCSFQDFTNSIKNIFNGGKKEEESGDNSSSGSQSSVSLEDMIAKMKPIAASLSGKSESAVTYVSYDSESEADFYTYDKDGLTFVEVDYEADEDDETASLESVYQLLTAQIPSGAVKDTAKSEAEEGYAYFDVYSVGSYYYCVYAEDFYGVGMIFDGFITIVPQSQYEAYYALISSGGDDEGGDYTAETAIDAVAELMTEYYQSTVTAKHDSDGDWIGLNFGTSATTDELKEDTENFIPTGFTTTATSWTSTQFSDGTPVEYIDYSCGDVDLRFCVYEDEGAILQVEAE